MRRKLRTLKGGGAYRAKIPKVGSKGYQDLLAVDDGVLDFGPLSSPPGYRQPEIGGQVRIGQLP